MLSWSILFLLIWIDTEEMYLFVEIYNSANIKLVVFIMSLLQNTYATSKIYDVIKSIYIFLISTSCMPNYLNLYKCVSKIYNPINCRMYFNF